MCQFIPKLVFVASQRGGINEMGTASLVFGLILIGKGLVVSFSLWNYWQFDLEVQPLYIMVILFLILCVPFFVAGGLFLRKYDSDKKK